MSRPKIPNKEKETQVRIFVIDKIRHDDLLSKDLRKQADITHYLLDSHDELQALKKSIAQVS